MSKKGAYNTSPNVKGIPWWAEKIRLLRQSLRLTQTEVGAKVGISRDYLSRLENGHHIPRIDTLEKIFSALGHNMAAAAPFPPSEKAIAWLKRNSWIQDGTENTKVGVAFSIHEGLVAEGFDSESDEYYQELDRRLEAFENESGWFVDPITKEDINVTT
tara:strand:+ start:1153 stop:1629 length:477 start_codon:yes stop_codon:yes gene_type:complete